MPLDKRNVDISFAQGIDTKTDSKQQKVSGKLVELENVVFTKGLQFNKRNGYEKLAELSEGVGLSTFKDELVGFDGSTLESYSPSTETVINKGPIVSVDLSTKSVFRSATSQTQQSSAFQANGVYLYTWVDSTHGAQYMVVSAETGNQVIPATTLPATAVFPKAWAIGNYLIVTYVNTATNALRYIPISVTTLNIGTTTDLSTQVDPVNRFYDGVVVNNVLYLSWNASDAAGAIRTTSLNRFLTQSNTHVQINEAASNCLAMWADESLSQLWISYHNGTEVKYFILNTGLIQVLAPTVIETISNILNMTGYATAGVGAIYYEVQNTYSYSSVRTDFIRSATLTNTGTVGSPHVFLRSVGIVSKSFYFDGNYYFVIAYNGTIQPTYFVTNQVGILIARIAYTNGNGYATQGMTCAVNMLSSDSFEFAYLFKSLLETQSGQIYTQTGVNSAVVDFSTNNIYSTVDIGNNLNISGGYLWSYDGYAPTEQNFHLFPEDFAATASSASTGLFPNSYSYIPIYRWTDNQGNIIRSGYGNPLQVNLVTATSGVTLNIPTLRLTTKNDVVVDVYRTAPSVATGIYYKVTSTTNPVFSSTAIDSVSITDNVQDAVLVGNELLYTTGGILPNSGGQPSISLANYKSRLIVVSAENRQGFYFSKPVLQSTPVEMAEEFFQSIDPRFGDLSAAAVMDDKLILFRAGAMTYVTGQGPDAAGANNDFNETYILAPVGTDNPNSIVLTPNGLMFQSNKGIWLLDRNLSTSYIGAEVEAYNSFLITSAKLIPNSTQVRFTLTNGTVLVYDYYFNQWGTFTNHDAAASTIFQDLFTYVEPSGNILQETPGSYSDNGNPIFMKIKSSWLSFAGFQGFQRAYRLYLKGEFVSPHILTISIAYDYNDNATQDIVINPSSLINSNWGSDPYWGSTQVWGGVSLEEQFRVNFQRQKCQAIQITITESLDLNNPVMGAGLILEAMGIVAGMKSTYPRLAPGKIVG